MKTPDSAASVKTKAELAKEKVKAARDAEHQAVTSAKELDKGKAIRKE